MKPDCRKRAEREKWAAWKHAGRRHDRLQTYDVLLWRPTEKSISHLGLPGGTKKHIAMMRFSCAKRQRRVSEQRFVGRIVVEGCPHSMGHLHSVHGLTMLKYGVWYKEEREEKRGEERRGG